MRWDGYVTLFLCHLQILICNWLVSTLSSACQPITPTDRNSFFSFLSQEPHANQKKVNLGTGKAQSEIKNLFLSRIHSFSFHLHNLEKSASRHININISQTTTHTHIHTYTYTHTHTTSQYDSKRVWRDYLRRHRIHRIADMPGIVSWLCGLGVARVAQKARIPTKKLKHLSLCHYSTSPAPIPRVSAGPLLVVAPQSWRRCAKSLCLSTLHSR